MPEPEEPDYAIPLHELTGKHGYALARNEDSDEPPEPGAPVAYVADPVDERPNTMTIEGAIVGIGNMASAAVRDEDPTSVTVLKIVLAAFTLPILVIVVARLTEWL